MIREIVKAIDGSDVELLRPENEADIRELRRMAEAGELDDTEMNDLEDEDEAAMIAAGLLPAE